MKLSFKQSDISPAMVSAVNALLMAKARAQLIRQQVDTVERAVLEQCPLTNGLEVEHGEPARKIIEPRHVYLCTDRPLLDEYYGEVSHRLRKEGIKPDTMPDEHCPALVAENLELECEWLLLDVAAEIMDFREGGKELNHRLLCLGLEKRAEFIDLWVKLVVNLPGYRNPLTGASVGNAA